MKTNKMSFMMAAMMAAALPFTARALTIGFESGEGYSAGNLAGQPGSGTQWAMTAGNSNIINVGTGIGVGGTNGIVGTSTGAGSNFVYYGFNTTNADIGSGFSFNSTSSILDYSFQWRPTQALDGGTTDLIFNFTVGSSETTGGNAALNLNIRAGNRFAALDGATTRPADNLFTLNTYSTISGTLNYATNTYTVFVDNVQQFTSFNSGNLAFQNVSSDNMNIRIGNLRGGTESATYRSWNADNISVIPEPSTLALLGIALGSVALSRRRK